jgi:hypothetical protein
MTRVFPSRRIGLIDFHQPRVFVRTPYPYDGTNCGDEGDASDALSVK